MSRRTAYPAGVPCWVDRLVADLGPARDFYGAVFGWELSGPGPMPGGGAYHVAQVAGDDVAGIAEVSAPPPGWTTYVAVERIEAAVERATAAGGSVLVAPFDAAPAGRGAVLADPAGLAIGVWQAQRRAGATRVNEASAWAMSALSSPDHDAARAFYAALFGWEPWTVPGDDSGLTLWRVPDYVGGEPSQPVPRDVVAALLAPDAAPAGWTVDFWVADADRAAEAARAHGGTVLAAPHDAPPFRRAALTDPEGAAFTVSELRLPA